jgi:hypothetical protein
MFDVLKVLTLYLLFSSLAFADDDDWDDRRGGRGYNQGYYQPVPPGYYREEIVYVPERVIEYVPPPPPQYGYHDQRSPQGLLGGIVGGVMGYEMGAGNPVTAGIGSAAGAWLGNGWY